MTKQNGVDVWPNAAIWMRDELRSKVRMSYSCDVKRSKYAPRSRTEADAVTSQPANENTPLSMRRVERNPWFSCSLLYSCPVRISYIFDAR